MTSAASMFKNKEMTTILPKQSTENHDSVAYVKGKVIFIELKSGVSVLMGHIHIFMLL